MINNEGAEKETCDEGIEDVRIGPAVWIVGPGETYVDNDRSDDEQEVAWPVEESQLLGHRHRHEIPDASQLILLHSRLCFKTSFCDDDIQSIQTRKLPFGSWEGFRT